MHILYDALRPYNVTSLTDPISITHFWTFSGTMMDFKLEPLEYLEETTGPTVTVEVNGLTFDMPVSWNVLAVEQDSYTVDTVPITACATFDHDILLFNPHDTKLVTTNIKIVDFNEKDICIHPMLPKGSAMAMPVAKVDRNNQRNYYSIIATPYDLHRYIGGCAVGEILG